MPYAPHSLHGSVIGFDENHRLIAQNPHGGKGTDGTDGVVLGSPLHPHASVAKVTCYDDFAKPVLDAGWNALKGSDGGAAYPVIAAANNGTVALVTSGAGTSSMAVSGSELTGGLVYKAANGNVVFEAKIAISAITTAVVFVGLTDNPALESAFNGSGAADGITSTATDAAGFLLSTNMTHGTKFWAVGVANDVDAVNVNTGITPVGGTFNTLRLELDAAGNATYFIDGVQVATVASAVTPTIALCPAMSIYELTTSARTLTADYMYAAGDRA